GGCVVPETRVATSIGLIQIGSLGPRTAEEKSWHALKEPLIALTDDGGRRVEEFYYNGRSQVRCLKTTHGYTFTGTPEHRVRVINADGEYVWKPLKDVQVGDWVALQTKTYPDSTDYRFATSERVPHFHATPIRYPDRPTDELGEFIGYFIGDGSISEYNTGGHTGRLILSIADAEPDVRDRLLFLADALFGLHPVENRKKDDQSTNYYFNATELVAWLAHIGARKVSALHAQLPELAFRAGADFARAVARGLFTADGTITDEGYAEMH